jgi:hypothetical protein
LTSGQRRTQAGVAGAENCFAAPGDLQLGEVIRAVGAHGLLAETELPGNLPAAAELTKLILMNL